MMTRKQIQVAHALLACALALLAGCTAYPKKISSYEQAITDVDAITVMPPMFTLAELGAFGLMGADSVSNLVRRAENRHMESAHWRETSRQIEASIGFNTEHKA